MIFVSKSDIKKDIRLEAHPFRVNPEHHIRFVAKSKPGESSGFPTIQQLVILM